MSHLHNIYDADPHFVIDPSTRKIVNNSGKVTLVQHDHNSERFTFEIPRMIDGHDMSKCDLVQIHYVNTSTASSSVNNPGVYQVDDLQVSPGSEDVVVFSWLVSGNATQYVGKLDFSIRFICDDGDGVPEYKWNTATHTEVVIISSICNNEEIVEENPDILVQFDARIKNLENGGSDIDVASDIKLDAPAVTDYIKGEEAYLYPSMMVRTMDLDWYKKYDFYQFGQYTITNKPRGILQLNKQIIDVNTSKIPTDPKNRFVLQDRYNASNKIECNSAVYVYEPLTNPDVPKNVLIVGDSISAYTPSWVNQVYNNHFKGLSNYKLIGSKSFEVDNDTPARSVDNNLLKYSVSEENSIIVYPDAGTENIQYEFTDSQSFVLKNSSTWDTTAENITPYILIPIDNTNLEQERDYIFKLDVLSKDVAYTDKGGKIEIVFANEAGSKTMQGTALSVASNDVTTSTIRFSATNNKPTCLKLTLPKKVRDISSSSTDDLAEDIEFKVSLESVNKFEATGGYTWNNYTCNPANLPDDEKGEDCWKHNPFWDENNHADTDTLITPADVTSYLRTNVGEGATLDYVICILGMNSFVNHAYFTDVYGNDVDAALNAIRDLCTHFISTVLSVNSECKVLLGSYCMPPFIDGVNNAYWNNLFERAEFIYRLNQLYQDIVLQYPNNVRFTHVTSQVDSQYAYPMGTKTINGAEYPFIDDSIQVHVNDVGHYQISEAMWRGFTGLVNM